MACYDLASRFSQLVEIHAAPEWRWRALVAVMLTDGCTAEPTRAAAADRVCHTVQDVRQYIRAGKGGASRCRLV